MGDDDAKKPEDEAPRDYAQLSATQRWLAGLVGLGGAGAGGAAIFISSNQAGSTTMLLVSLVFLLIAIQGTPIRRASKDSVDFVGHEVARRVNAALEKSGPEAAREALESYREASPEAERSPAVARAAFDVMDAQLYEKRVKAVLKTLAHAEGNWEYKELQDSAIADIMISSPKGNLWLSIKWVEPGGSMRHVGKYMEVLRQHFSLISTQRPYLTPYNVLIVTNSEYLPERIHFASEDIKFIRWDNFTHTAPLYDAIKGILAAPTLAQHGNKHP